MNNQELLQLVVNGKATVAERLEAIETLGRIRREEMQPGALHLGALPGTAELRAVMWEDGEPLQLRCEAASVLADTDIATALEVCVNLL